MRDFTQTLPASYTRKPLSPRVPIVTHAPLVFAKNHTIFCVENMFLVSADIHVMYRLLQNPLEQERLQEIITEAVEIEKEFIVDSLPVSLPCMLCHQQLY